MFLLFVASWFYYIGGGFQISGPTLSASVFSDLTDQYAWAKDAVNELSNKKIITGMTDTTFAPNESVTREQFAKMLTNAFHLPLSNDKTQIYEDVPTSRWSFSYIKSAKETMGIYDARFQPTKVVTREEAASIIVKALGLTEEKVNNINVLEQNFGDGILVAPDLKKSVVIAYQNNLISGVNGQLMPFDPIRRAEMAVMLYRALNKPTKQEEKTTIMGQTETTVEAAKAWAESRGADQRFVDVADYYWKYGKQTGIKPEVLYSQAAKETNFGKYTGNVKAEMNNWAGIKKLNGTGDATDAHESFATPEEGVIAHFNHMAAYVGISPIGTPHARYSVVKNQPWAGTIKYVEDLGGKWAPDPEYGKSIVSDYLSGLEPSLK